MTNAPPCATCGSPLRWYPDHYGWGCDRCRQFHPSPRPAAPAGPPQRATPLPAALVPAPVPPPAFQPINLGRKRSPLPILIGVGGIAVIAIGIAVILKVKGDRRGGAKTRQEVIEQTFAALEAGDADRLLELGDNGVLFTRVMDCDKRGDDDDDDRRERRKRRGDDDDDDDFDFRDPEKVAERSLRETKRQAAVHKGVKIEVLDVLTREPPKLDDKHVDDDEDDDRDRRRRDRDREYEKKSERDRDRYRDRDHDDDDRDRDRDLGVTTTKKGKKIVKGCYAKTTFRMQRVKVRIRVTEDDREPDTQKVDLNIVELDGRYYLSNAPEIKLHNSYGRHLNVMRDEMCECTDSKCTGKLDKEWKRFNRFTLREAKDRLKKDELKALEPVEKEVKECRKRAGGKADASEDTVSKMMEVTEKMCACKDKACSEKVQEEFTRWGTEMAKKGGDREDTDPDVQKKITDVMTKYSECMLKLYSSDSTGLEAAPSGMPYVCSEQREITTKLMGCSGVTSTRKSMFKDDWERLARRWRDAGSTERVEIEAQCRSTTDLLRRQQSTYSCY